MFENPCASPSILDRQINDGISIDPTYIPHALLFNRNGIGTAGSQSSAIGLLRFDSLNHGFCLVGFREIWRKLQGNLERLQRIPSVPISEIRHPEMVINRR